MRRDKRGEEQPEGRGAGQGRGWECMTFFASSQLSVAGVEDDEWTRTAATAATPLPAHCKSPQWHGAP